MVGAQLTGFPLGTSIWTPARRGRQIMSERLVRKNYNVRCRAGAPNWAVVLCDHLETMIFASDPINLQSPRLCDAFEPVPEMAPTTHLRVTGTIPEVESGSGMQECLNGAFMRVSPNPRFKPRGGQHWVDGDGMIHGMHLKNGKATYVARYVQTHRLQQEERYGAPKFFRVGDLKGMKGLYCVALEALRRMLGILYTGSEGVLLAGQANASLVYHNNKLLALQEGDKPYMIKVLEDGDLQTVGLEDFEEKLQHSFGAHPKIDPDTGEMFTIGLSALALLSGPRLIYRVVSKEGMLGEPVLITNSSVMHDFAITKNYAIFMDLPLGLDVLVQNIIVEKQIRKERILGPTKVNAWEEENEVVLICCRLDDIELEHLRPYIEKDTVVEPILYEYRMNLQTGVAKQRQLSNLIADFPRINPDYTGRKTRYAYCYTGDHERFTGVAKFDFTKEPPSLEGNNKIDLIKAEGNLAGLYVHGQNRIGGDTVFVPRHQGKAVAAEDDGYLISYVHDEMTGKSEAIIIDAKTMGPEPMAVVELPGRVSHGFHAYFITEE